MNLIKKIFGHPLKNPLRFDVALAERALKQVVMFPATHDQRTVMRTEGCAQVGCIMGWVQFMADDKGLIEYMAYDRLGLTESEFYAIYADVNNETAIKRFWGYINYAKKMQARAGYTQVVEPVHELSADDRAALDIVTATKVGV